MRELSIPIKKKKSNRRERDESEKKMSTYRINIETLFPSERLKKQSLKELMKAVLTAEQAPSAAITLVLVDDDYITKLNKEFLKKETTTDVLSFNFGDKALSDFLEGEVYANLDQIKRQAKDYHVTFEEELYRIIVHGLLHLLGYDDHDGEAQQIMTAKEDAYLSSFNQRLKEGG